LFFPLKFYINNYKFANCLKTVERNLMSKNLSVQKRIRQAEKARLRNKHYKSMMKNMVKKVKAAETKVEAESLYREAVSTIDSITSKGIIHKNSAANKKSKLAAHIAKLS